MSTISSEHQMVQQLKAAGRRQGERFSSILLIRKLTSRTSRNNNQFLQIEFGDRTGSFSVVCFDDNPLYKPLSAASEGQVVLALGEVEHYQNRFSPRLVDITFLGEEESSEPAIIGLLAESSPENLDDLMLDLYRYIEGIRHPGLRATVEGVFAEIGPVFKEAAAAIAMHHAYRGGLLEHTVHMARVCQRLLPLYPEVDPDMAMSGILLHDTGKTVEYINLLNVKRTRAGILQGHVVLGYRMVRKAGMRARLEEGILERLEHIILSHQGELEWGAAAMAATPEAVFVAMIDNLDAKMGAVQQALRQKAKGEEFSDYLPPLKTTLLMTPVQPTEEPDADYEDMPASGEGAPAKNSDPGNDQHELSWGG